MPRFQEPEWPEELPFECEADYDDEIEAGGEEGLDDVDADDIVAVFAEDAEEQESWPDEVDGDAFDEDGAERSVARRRGRGSPALPFQFQIPLGGSGGLGLGIPIGGRSSPFALSVPLTSPPPPPAPPQAQPTPTPTASPVAVGADEPPLTTALDLGPDPMAAATAHAAETGEIDAAADEICGPDCDHEFDLEDEASMAEALRIDEIERRYYSPDYSRADETYAGERMMAAVSATLDATPVSSASLMTALGEAMDHGEDSGENDQDPPVSLYQVFRRVADRSGPAPRLFGRDLRVLAQPGEPLGGVQPLRGDLLLRALPGHRWIQLSFVAEPGLVNAQHMAERGLDPEGGVDMLPGHYVQVVEAWPVRRDEQDRYCRRLANAADLVLLDTMLLRLQPPGVSAPAERQAAEDESSRPSQPVLGPGASGDPVTALQGRLNDLHAKRIEAGQPGLGDMPLVRDGRYGPRMRSAVLALQRLAPAGLAPALDGVMRQATWNALALLEASAAMLASTPPVPTRPRAPGGAVIEAGQKIIQRLPLLASHRGTPPDLVLRWNAMQSIPERVDVVIHLHGFSGRGEAMRIDLHKLPDSGLDFINPANPAEAGRTRPTLAVLPRGNFYGGASGAGYNFPALFAPAAFGQLLTFALEQFAGAVGMSRAILGRLTMTAHSGGGAALMRLLAQNDPDEIHCFDALYGRADALIRWAEARLRAADPASAALRVLYRAGEPTAGNSREVANAIGSLTRGNAVLERRYRVEATREPHNGIPRRYGWRLLADAGADLDLGGRQEKTPRAPLPAGGERLPEDLGERWLDAPPGEVSPTDGLQQGEIDRLAAREFGSSAELEAFFSSVGGFGDWFNRELSGRPPFVRPGGGGPLRMPTGEAARGRFHGFWDRLALAYGIPRISLLEFASLLAIVLNETDGDFAARTESSGRGGGGRTDSRGRHPGLAYFFDRIELRPGHSKASYNHLSGGRTAGSLFDDELYIRAHGTLGGADRLARHGNDFDRVWHGHYYPQDHFSTDEQSSESAFVREADFYKFRGRGIIQTTGRASYIRLARYVREYAGTNPMLRALAAHWARVSEDQACTISTNQHWEQLFGIPDMLALAFSFHSGGRNSYRMMNRRADVLNAVPPAGTAGMPGSIYLMGRRISGSHGYGAGIYRDRVTGLMRKMAQLEAPRPPVSPPRPGSTRSPSQPPPPGQELEHRRRRPEPAPSAPAAPARGPVPAPDLETARTQWRANPRAHGYFGNSEAKYMEFAPLFAQRGVGDAAAYLGDNMTGLHFFGRRQDGHRNLAAPLQAAERAMAGHTIDPPIRLFGCLNVRKIAGTNRLSFHALGRAIDLDHDSNPHIKSGDDFLVIHAVTGLDLRGERSPARLHEASRQFQRDFTEEWIARQNDRRILAVLAQRSARTRLQGYARHGFCALYLPLIEALIAAGLSWGGSWSTSKDFMHFELR